MNRLLILQPYIPSYRVAFFRDLRSSLRNVGFELMLAAGRPEGRFADRGDDCTDSAADFRLSTRSVGTAGKSIFIRDVRSVLRDVQPDMVIAEQAIKNLDNYSMLLRQAVHVKPRFGLWGQGRAFSTPQGRVSTSVKNWLTRQSDWFFAYTQEGADYIIQHGARPSRVTVVNNSVDAEQLRRDLEDVEAADVEVFQRLHSLVPGQTALFLGGVDPAKGIDFLLHAAERVAAQIPGFKLLVAGSGSSSDRIMRYQQEGGPVVYLGRLDGFEKAVALRAADLMMIPEWVGLVAVDALVSGCPIVTTDHPSHSPEFGYLADEANAVVLQHRADDYATGVVRLLGDRQRLSRIRQQGIEDSSKYSLNEMVQRFTQGIEAWWQSTPMSSKD